MKRVLHINTYLDKGGAAKSIQTLSNQINIRNNNFNSFQLAGFSIKSKSKLTANEILLYSNSRKYLYALFTRLTGYDSLYYPFQDKKKVSSEIEKADLIHLHNLHGYFIDYIWLLNEIKRMSKPIVWTLRDFWTVSGKCCFPSSDKKLAEKCSSCDCLNEYPKVYFIDKIEEMYSKKRKIINDLDDVYFVSISNTVKKRLKKTFLQNQDIRVIHNGFDIEQYNSPHNVKTDKFEILFVASDPEDPRKGLSYLIKAIENIGIDDINLNIVGKKVSKETLKNINSTQYGYIYDNKKLNRIYSKSDIFINPTLDETFGRTTIEALLNALPVIAFRIPIMEEILGSVGIYAEKRNVEELSKKIRQSKKMLEKNKIDQNKLIERGKKFSNLTMVNKYIDLYNEILI